MSALESNVRGYCRTFTPTFSHGEQSFLVDTEGQQHLDFLSACGSLNYGHNHPVLKSALLSYIEGNGVAMSLDLVTDTKEQFIDTFNRLILQPRELTYRFQFTGPTGANAVEAAIKLARKSTGRSNVVAFTNAFHGCSLGALALTANSHHRGTSSALLSNVTRMPYDGYLGDGVDTAAYLEKMLSDPSSGCDKPAAIIFETVQGEGGLNCVSPAWAQSVAQIARAHQIPLIVDEIQIGCGRSGSFFSFDALGIEPDIVVMAKSLSGFGLPMSLVLLKPELDVWAPGEHNGTFRGNNHAFVTATAALKQFWQDGFFQQDLQEKISLLSDQLAFIASRYGFSVKGRGFMQGIDFGNGVLAGEVQKHCVNANVIIETCGPNDEILKLLPPLTIDKETLLDGLSRIDNAISIALENTYPIKAVQ